MSRFNDEIDQDDSNLIVEICGKYLGIDWQTNNIIIKRFAEGYFNKIFYCKLNDNKIKQKPIVIKLSLKEEFFLYKPLFSLINTLIVSESKLGPKLLSTFPGGLITEYIDSRTFGRNDYENTKITKVLAQKLAKFHSIKSPIPRDGSKKWMFHVIDDFLEMEQSVAGNGGTFDVIRGVYEIIKLSKYKSLKRLDYYNQMNWIKHQILKADKILVFSHCDFNRGNILIHENSECFDIFLIDFDFCSYNFRGIDFGRYFSSWKQKDPNFGYEDYPTDQQMIPFIDAYIQERDRLTKNEFSKNELNSRQHIIKEAKLFTLVGILIDVLFCIWKVGIEPNCAEEFLEKGDQRYAFYLNLKERFQNENSI